MRMLRFGFACAAAVAMTGADASDGEATTLELAIDAPRPVAEMLDRMERTHRTIITYEDPAYVYSGDLVDVTTAVRRDLLDAQGRPRPAESVPRVIVPRRAQLEFSYAVSSETGEPDDLESVVSALLDEHAARNHPGRFRVDRRGDYLHVVPTECADELGQWTPFAPLLDQVIAFESRTRTGLETLETILAALDLSPRTTRIEPGVMPLNPLVRQEIEIGADSEPARDVLVRTLDALGGVFSWRLYYDPGLDWYVLNLHHVH